MIPPETGLFVVVCIDLATGARSYSGPYPRRTCAAEAARHEQAAEDAGQDRLVFRVQPLLREVAAHTR